MTDTQETDEQAELRVAKAFEELLSKENMALSVSIVKVPVQVAPGQYVFADKPHVEIKRKKVELLRPDANTTAAINNAIKATALGTANGQKQVFPNGMRQV